VGEEVIFAFVCVLGGLVRVGREGHLSWFCYL